MATDRSGNQFEIDCMNYLREHEVTADRLAKAGRLDEGDLAVQLSSGLFVVEAKARRSKTNQLTLGSYMAEAVAEAAHYAAAREIYIAAPVPTVFLKRPGKSIGDCYAILRLQDFARL
jgi:Holliday junction resolvase